MALELGGEKLLFYAFVLIITRIQSMHSICNGARENNRNGMLAGLQCVTSEG